MAVVQFATRKCASPARPQQSAPARAPFEKDSCESATQRESFFGTFLSPEFNQTNAQTCNEFISKPWTRGTPPSILFVACSESVLPRKVVNARADSGRDRFWPPVCASLDAPSVGTGGALGIWVAIVRNAHDACTNKTNLTMPRFGQILIEISLFRSRSQRARLWWG